MASSSNGRLRTPTKLTPSQGISSTFVQTNEGSRGRQIAEALSGFNSGINQLQNNYMNEKRKEERRIDALEAAQSQERLVGATGELKALLEDPANARLSQEDFMKREDVQAIINKSTEGLSQDASELLGLRLTERFSSVHGLANKAQANIDRVDSASKFALYTIEDRLSIYKDMGMTDDEISKEMAPVFSAVEQSLKSEYGLSNKEVMDALKSVQARRGLDHKDAYLGEWVLEQTWGGNDYKEEITNLVYNARNQREADLRAAGQEKFTPFEVKAMYGELTKDDYDQLDQMVIDGFISEAERAQIEITNTREYNQAQTKLRDAEARSSAMSDAVSKYAEDGFFTPISYTKSDGTEVTLTAKQLEDKLVMDAMKKFDGNLKAQIGFFVQNPSLKNPYWEGKGKLLGKQLAAGDVVTSKETMDMFDAIYALNPSVLSQHLTTEDMAVYTDYRMLSQAVGQEKALGMLVNNFGSERPEISAKDAYEFADSFLSRVEGWTSNGNDQYIRDYAYKMWKRVGKYVHMDKDEFGDFMESQLEASTVEVNGRLVYTLGMDMSSVGGKEGFQKKSQAFIKELTKDHPFFSAYKPEQLSLYINPRMPNTFSIVRDGVPDAMFYFTMEDIKKVSTDLKVAKKNAEMDKKQNETQDDIDAEVQSYLRLRGYQ